MLCLSRSAHIKAPFLNFENPIHLMTCLGFTFQIKISQKQSEKCKSALQGLQKSN